MRKLLLVGLIILSILMLAFAASRITILKEDQKGYIIVRNQQIVIPTNLFEGIKSYLNGSFQLNDTPSCPMSEDFQLVLLSEDNIETHRYLIGNDSCGTFYDIKTGLYIEGKKEAKRIIDQIIHPEWFD